MKELTYKSSGVDLESIRSVQKNIGNIATSTHGPEVLSSIGSFGAMYQLSGYNEPVLVSSTDGVGTKLKLAIIMNKYDTIGRDLVNACVNDVIVSGAQPLFFLDYIGIGKLDTEVVSKLIEGMASACEEIGCALIGGETAQMPGIYADGDFDVVGFILGAVEKKNMIDSSRVRESDVLLGIPSNGLHTNGYSLVRHSLGLDDDSSPLNEFHSELGNTLGDALLMEHRCYYQILDPVFGLLKAMAHITGGGLIENVPRVVPEGLVAKIDSSAWHVPAIFKILQNMGDISTGEMYKVFNMGLGMVLVCDKILVSEIMSLVPEAKIVGEITRGFVTSRVVFDDKDAS